jgi:hypothetical protein
MGALHLVSGLLQQLGGKALTKFTLLFRVHECIALKRRVFPRISNIGFNILAECAISEDVVKHWLPEAAAHYQFNSLGGRKLVFSRQAADHRE